MTEQTDAAEVITLLLASDWLAARGAAAEARGAERALREAVERVRGPSEFLRDEGTCHSIAFDLEAAAAARRYLADTRVLPPGSTTPPAKETDR